jgi:exonuclease III
MKNVLQIGGIEKNNCKESKENYSMIDHILTTKNLQKKIKKTFMYHGYKEYCGKWDSDHYPVVVDFDFNL